LPPEKASWICAEIAWQANFLKHNRFGWQGKTPTTNGVFRPKKAQFRIVETGGFSYLFQIR